MIQYMFSLSSWLLYEKPGFQGRTIALEEGPTEVVNEWSEIDPGQEVGPNGMPLPTKPLVIGSIRLAVRVRAHQIVVRGKTVVVLKSRCQFKPLLLSIRKLD